MSKRAREARIYIRDRILDLQEGGKECPEVVVVTHGGFLHYFTEDWEDSGAYNGEFIEAISLSHLFSVKLACSFHRGPNFMYLFRVLAYTNGRINELRWDIPGTGWRNVEYRSFIFADLNHSSTSKSITDTQSSKHLDDYENATLRETKESRTRRGKEDPQHGRDKQAELFNAATQGCKDQSTQNPDKTGKVEEHEEDEEEALARVLTKDSENADKRCEEAPATDKRGSSTTDAVAKERERSKSLSVQVDRLIACNFKANPGVAVPRH